MNGIGGFIVVFGGLLGIVLLGYLIRWLVSTGINKVSDSVQNQSKEKSTAERSQEKNLSDLYK